jgi:hypothetical protein
MSLNFPRDFAGGLRRPLNGSTSQAGVLPLRPPNYFLILAAVGKRASGDLNGEITIGSRRYIY